MVLFSVIWVGCASLILSAVVQQLLTVVLVVVEVATWSRRPCAKVTPTSSLTMLSVASSYAQRSYE
jgi:hypothetical protein